MPIIVGPVGTLIVAFAAIVALIIWLRRDRRYPGPRLHSDDDGIDYEELEAAEREVRDQADRRTGGEGMSFRA